MGSEMCIRDSYELELRSREDAAAAAHSQQSDIDFGSQIRSYVLHPYKQIKDLRSGFTVNNVEPVLDGDLDGFVEAFLLMEGSDEHPVVVDDDDFEARPN